MMEAIVHKKDLVDVEELDLATKTHTVMFLKDTVFSDGAKHLSHQNSWNALGPQHCDYLIKLINLVGLDEFLEADLEVMARICGGTSADFDRHAFTREVLSTSHSDEEDVKTSLTILALNYKIGKMTYLAANIITKNY